MNGHVRKFNLSPSHIAYKHKTQQEMLMGRHLVKRTRNL